MLNIYSFPAGYQGYQARRFLHVLKVRYCSRPSQLDLRCGEDRGVSEVFQVIQLCSDALIICAPNLFPPSLCWIWLPINHLLE